MGSGFPDSKKGTGGHGKGLVIPQYQGDDDTVV